MRGVPARSIPNATTCSGFASQASYPNGSPPDRPETTGNWMVWETRVADSPSTGFEGEPLKSLFSSSKMRFGAGFAASVVVVWRAESFRWRKEHGWKEDGREEDAEQER